MNWKKLKFIDLFDYENKSSIKAGDGLCEGKYPFYSSSSIQSKYLNEFSFENISLIFGTGGNASIHHCEKPFSVSTDCLVAIAKNKNMCHPKFVYYYLSGNINILEEGFKGAGLKHISKAFINEIQIPLPPLLLQKRIAQILDVADALRRKGQELLNKYDELAQAIFIDMFGKTEKNVFKPVAISDIIEGGKNKLRSGPFGSDLLHSEFVDSGIFVLGIDNVVNNKFEINRKRFITEEKFNALSRYQVYPGDVLISVMATIGRTAVVPDNLGKAINSKHLVAITPNKEIIDSFFLSYLFANSQSIKRQIKQKTKGAIMDGLNLGIIKELSFNLPPIGMQKIFIEKLKIIEHQKKLVLTSNSGLLFDSLLQKAFKGELVK